MRDKHVYVFVDIVADSIAAYFAAKADGTATEWLTRQFTADYATLDLSDAAIVSDLIASSLSTYRLDTYLDATGR